jgi:hypothetical protein
MESEIIVLNTEYTKIAYILYVDSSLIFQLLLAFVVLLNIVSTVFWGGQGIFLWVIDVDIEFICCLIDLHLGKSVM